MAKPGPKAGSEGAKRIAEAHRGSQEHDKRGGFAADPELARSAGQKGGSATSVKYGPDFYRDIGKKGGDIVAQRGPEFFAEVGRKGGMKRSENAARKRMAAGQESSGSDDVTES